MAIDIVGYLFIGKNDITSSPSHCDVYEYPQSHLLLANNMLVQGLLELVWGHEVYLWEVGFLPLPMVTKDGGEVDPSVHGHVVRVGGGHRGLVVVVGKCGGGAVADNKPAIAGGTVKSILGREWRSEERSEERSKIVRVT